MIANNIWIKAVSLVLCLGLAGCATTPAKKARTARFKAVSFSQVDGWDDDEHSSAMASFAISCKKILKLDVGKNISRATQLGGTAFDWQMPCLDAKNYINPTDLQAKKFFEKWFTPYQISDDKWGQEGLLTGYYQIELEGSKKKTGKYQHPVYRKPQDLHHVKGTDAINHASINNGALNNKGLEIAYVDNKARLYFMQIQGSGIVRLKEGGHINLGFEDHNGYKFQGITQALKRKNLKFNDATSMMDYLHNDPKNGKEIIEQDPSYVFFKPLSGVDTVGGHGVTLKPERSLAIDYQLYPYGTPIWVKANLPVKSIFNGRQYKRLFIAQDTGGAIRGAIRGDVFFGRGKGAEKVASNFKAQGKFYALFPKTVNIPESYTTK